MRAEDIPEAVAVERVTISGSEILEGASVNQVRNYSWGFGATFKGESEPSVWFWVYGRTLRVFDEVCMSFAISLQRFLTRARSGTNESRIISLITPSQTGNHFIMPFRVAGGHPPRIFPPPSPCSGGSLRPSCIPSQT